MTTRRVLFDLADAADFHPEQRHRVVPAILAADVFRSCMQPVLRRYPPDASRPRRTLTRRWACSRATRASSPYP